MSDQTETRTDFTAGVAIDKLADGAILAGRVGDDDALLIRRGEALFAIGAQCSHYHGALADGLLVGDAVRCPLHHAEFDLATGEALRAPALDPIPCWRVEKRDGRAYVHERVVAPPRSRRACGTSTHPERVVIVGGGAAGLAAAQMLRRAGHQGRITMVSADDSPPCDRPNLSKDYLAGTAQDDWIALRPDDFYSQSQIDLLLSTRATALDTSRRELRLEDGRVLPYDALLLATGADPLRIDVPGADPGRLHTLRTFSDSQAIVAATVGAKRVAVIGSSFIGLEVAASLRSRGIEVHVVGREALPMERVLGDEVGRWVRALHEAKGVVFHMGASPARLEGTMLTLTDGSVIEGCDVVVVGAGVRPALVLAEQAGLTLDRGVLVDEFLQTSASGVYAAGDIARWPDPHTGERIRVEHWVVAQAQGQAAALNMLGERKRFDAVPFFWSQHYDTTISYVGHAERWDRIDIDGSLEQRDATVRYRLGDRVLAIVTLGRDLESLRCEAAFEQSLRS